MKRLASVLSLLLVGSLGCKKAEPPPPTPPPTTVPATTLPAPLTVTTLTLGNAIGPDKRVTAPMEAFGPKDTIYASVETTGAGRGKVRALWTFVKGQKTAKVDETTIELDATAPTTNEFHVSKPSGWPKGEYRIEVFLGEAGTPALTKTFKVG
jgi:hypothetical protein